MEDDSNVLIDMEKKKVTLSMILKWYSVDFGKNNQEVLEFVVNYLTGVSNIELIRSRIHGLAVQSTNGRLQNIFRRKKKTWLHY